MWGNPRFPTKIILFKGCKKKLKTFSGKVVGESKVRSNDEGFSERNVDKGGG